MYKIRIVYYFYFDRSVTPPFIRADELVLARNELSDLQFCVLLKEKSLKRASVPPRILAHF